MMYRSTFLSVLVLLAGFAAAPIAARAQVGTCGGVAQGVMNTTTCVRPWIQCSSTQRVAQQGSATFTECPRNSGDFYNYNIEFCQPDPTCTNPNPTASLTANPSTIFQGNVTTLSWSSTNATSCSSPDFNTGGATSGAVNVAPLTSRSYALTCVNAINAQAQGSATVTVQPPPFSASCSPNRTSALVGEPVIWNASAANGTAPYSFEWFGQMLSGLTGSSRTVTYDTPGTKTASVQATDSASLGAGLQISMGENDMCSGPMLIRHLPGTQVEDGGSWENMQRTTRQLVETTYYDPQNYPFFDQSSAARAIYADLRVNPQNYCVAMSMGRRCVPSGVEWEGCNWTWYGSIHQGTGRRGLTLADAPPGYPNQRYSATGIGSIAAGVPRTTTAACTAPVTVTAPAAPTASLSANPVSIIQGQSSRLTWSSTNATSCTGTGFSTGGATSGQVDVSPSSTANYSVQCTGAGGTSPVANASVSVTPALAASCSVSPTSINTGGSATWTAFPSGGTGVYTYSWTGTDGLSGTTQAVQGTYTTAGTKTASVTVTSGTQNVTVACANSLSVVDAPRPNLTAGIGGTVTLVAGQAGTFTGTTQNNGAASAPAGFNDLFIFYHADQATWQGWQYAAPSGALGVNASVGRSVTYSFSTPGTYYYRLCADWNNGVAESNEGDNCSALSTVIVRPADPTNLSAACAADGRSVTLSWTAPPTGGPYNYYVRLQDSVTGVVDNRDGYVGTSIVMPVIPGRTYGWWLHSNIGAADYDGNRYSPGVGGPSFSCAGQADLTAGPITPTTATAGQATTLFATATNLPSASGASGGFPILFQVRQGGTVQRSFESQYIGGFAPGGSGQGSANHTFPSPGTYEARACANMNTGMVAIVTESNYGNNCGDWTTITVAPPPPTGSLSCAVSNTQPAPNTSVTYTVTPSNGATGPYVWDDTQGGAYGSGSSVSRLIPGAGPFVMFVSGQNVISQPVACPSVSGVCPNPTATITANPTRVRIGQTSTITWNATGVDGSCTVSGPGVNQTVTGGSCVIPTGSATPTISTQSTYRITCDGDSNHSAQVIVNVIPEFEEF